LKLKKPMIKLGHRASVYGICADTDTNQVYTADGAGQLVRWSPDDPDGFLLAQGESPWFVCAYSSAQSVLIAGNQAGQIWWVDPQKLTVLAQIEAHKGGTYAIFALDASNHTISGGADGVLHLWENQTLLQSLKLSHRNLRGLSISLDQNTLAVASSDGCIYLVDIQEFTVINVIKDAHMPSVFAVCFSTCGRYLFSGGRDAMLCVWSVVEAYQLLHKIPAHHYTINSICASPDGFGFYTASRDRTIKYWDAIDFGLLKVLDAARYSVHTASVNNMVWCSDLLWSCSDDKRVVAWDI
jgi:WD40 repeat protein